MPEAVSELGRSTCDCKSRSKTPKNGQSFRTLLTSKATDFRKFASGPNSVRSGDLSVFEVQLGLIIPRILRCGEKMTFVMKIEPRTRPVENG
jgi:hypothetical protein